LTDAARRIDAHTHFLTTTLAEALEAREEIPRIVARDGRRFVEYGPGLAYPLLPDMLDLDQKLARLDGNGIDLAVLTVNIPGADGFEPAEAVAVSRAINDELVELVSRHRDRLAALATLPLRAGGDAAADELERAVSSGLRGGMLYSNVAGRPLDDAGLRPMFARAAALDVPFLLHPTYPLSAATVDVHMLIPVIGFLFDTTTAALRLVLDGLYDRHPQLKLLLGHTGSLLPFILGRIAYEGGRLGSDADLETSAPEAIRRLYTDTVCNSPGALRLALETFEPGHVVFGSDAPFWEPQPTYETIATLELDPAAEEALFAGNATRLFGLSL
jgi:predicted TIM-barrel fold metal-dependent hydrolase